MDVIKRHKEFALLIGTIAVLGIASYGLLNKPQQNSDPVNSATALTPESFGDRIMCEVPIPSIGSRKIIGDAEGKVEFVAPDMINSTENGF